MKPEDAAWLIRDAIRHPAKYGIVDCVLCGADPAFTAVFTPTPSFAKRIGQPKGKERIVVYGLCQDCAESPDISARVERAMIEDLGVQ